MSYIETETELEAIYGAPARAAVVKVLPRIIPEYRAWIEASPFCALATVGPEGLDASPRGDPGAVATILDETTLALPDRRGNNRIDSLRNIVRDPRVALMFMIPGRDTVIRVNGEARVSVDPALLDRLAHEGQRPRTVIVVKAREVYFQCARAVMRAALWSAASPHGLPSAGEILAACSRGEIDANRYDAEWPARAQASLW